MIPFIWSTERQRTSLGFDTFFINNLYNKIRILKYIFYIQSLVKLQKDKKTIRVFINFGSEVKAISLVYIVKLDFRVYSIAVGVEKTDSFFFKIFDIVITSFQVFDKFSKIKFFKKMFLLANSNIKVVLEILFLIFSNANI